MARNLDFPAVNTAELEDGLRVWKRLLLEGQPADAPIVVLARGKVVRWLEDFLRQSGNNDAGAIAGEVADHLAGLGSAKAGLVLHSLKGAESLGKLVAANADEWHPTLWPQGWALLPFLLGCALRFVAGSSLMDIASMLGFPPIRWSLRAVLFLVHYFLLAVAVLLWTGQDTLAEGWGPFALTVGTWIFLSHFISTFGDKDLPERQEKVQALQAGRGAAEALQGLQAAECPAHASLLEALRAFGARYIAVLDGDEERLAFVLRAIAKWKDPIGTLWGWLCRWIRALRG